MNGQQMVQSPDLIVVSRDDQGTNPQRGEETGRSTSLKPAIVGPGTKKFGGMGAYSWRKARMGFMVAARRAGIQLAAVATAINSAAEAANVMGSQERRP
jgi:hypothetical protein